MQAQGPGGPWSYRAEPRGAATLSQPQCQGADTVLMLVLVASGRFPGGALSPGSSCVSFGNRGTQLTH